jgi:nickel/cobalt exporter
MVTRAQAVGGRAQLGIALLAAAVLLVQVPAALAHPVPKDNHDRTIAVHLREDTEKTQIVVLVDYRLEVDDYTAIYIDLPALGEKVDFVNIKQPLQYYDAFVRGYAPILAANLVATMDGQPLSFRCVKQGFTLQDEKGNELNHLRCDFRFEAEARSVWPEWTELVSCWPKPGLPTALVLRGLLQRTSMATIHNLRFAETNYVNQPGQIRLALDCAPSLHLLSKVEPDAKLLAKPATELEPGDDARLRNAETVFSVPGATPLEGKLATATGSHVEEPVGASKVPSLHRLFVESKYGFWMLLVFSAAIGAVHALTPGHGKTLVAAYLVGERGTVAHALILGVVTTLTHTGVVIAVAIALRWFAPQGESGRQGVQTALGLGGGLLIVMLGAWLLLRRLTGQVDHIHLPGQGHHHHHHDHHHGHESSAADHYHDDQGHVHYQPVGSQSVGWWRLIVLGISGGIIPCWDAILMLIVAVSTNLLWLALPMLLAFSTGLAGVLVLIGILVVRMKGFAGSRWGQSRLFRALPVASAAAVTAIGLWLCYDSVHAKGPVSAPVPVSGSATPSSPQEPVP